MQPFQRSYNMAYPTNPIYKLGKSDFATEPDFVFKSCSGNRVLTIPFVEGNTDYAEYLKWAETNTAEAAS